MMSKGRHIKPELLQAWTDGSTFTRLSFVIMGAGNLARKQIVKGLLFLSLEIGFFVFLAARGINALAGLVTLGTKTQDFVYDPELGFSVSVPGDNSMIMLIYGICTVGIILVFLLLWRLSVQSSYALDRSVKAGRRVPNFVEDVATLLDSRFHITLLSIPVLSIVVFTALPLVYMISIAFTNYDHNHLPPKNLFEWVGFETFRAMFTGNIAGTFFPLLGWTLVWAVFATFTCFFFGVLLAVFINARGVWGKKILRVLFVITLAVPPFVSLLVMRNMLHASGPINAMLQSIGLIDQPIPFLTDGLMAKISVIVVNMWIGIPATMLVATGILITLPTDQLEAARVDGATGLQLFRYITFPQILTVMAPSLIQQFIGNINNFNVIYLLTGGLPVNSNYYGAGETDLLVTWLYKLTVDNADYNLASVVGIITFVLSAALSLLIYTRTNSYQEGGGKG